jgi:Phospholipase_D-nuclease N-terminal
MAIAADYPFLDVMWTMVVFFIGLGWIAVVVMVLVDVLRRHDLSGWRKAGWTVALLVIPFIAVLAYVVANGRPMSQRISTHRGASPPAYYGGPPALADYYDPSPGGRTGARPRLL